MRNEILELREAFGTTLLSYKDKMQEAYQTKEQRVEEELLALKKHFDNELNKISSRAAAAMEDEGDPASLVSASSMTNYVPVVRRPGTSASDEENRPLSSRSVRNSQDLAKIFADATRDAKGQLKRPPGATGPFQQQQGSSTTESAGRQPLQNHNP